jgi:hypothetical protein
MSTPIAQYLVRGGDGRDYPADLLSLMAWAAERRLLEHQFVFVTAAGAWRRASEIPELRGVFARRLAIVPPTRSESARTLPVNAVVYAASQPGRPMFVAGASLQCCSVFLSYRY